MYLGIDLGGTSIKAGIVNQEGEILLKDQAPTGVSDGLDQMIENICNLGRKLLSKAQEQHLLVEAVGLGVPGPVDQDGRVIKCVNLSWPVVPIAQILTDKFGIPVFAANDGNAAGMGEAEAGVLKGAESGIILTLGTGIGGGVILNGTCRVGYNGIGGEIGHMIVGENFYNCNCGRNGCLETFSSVTGLINYTKKLLLEGEGSSLIQRCTEVGEPLESGLSKLNGFMIVKEAQAGDALAQKAVDRVAYYLSIGITNLVSVLDPQIIAIGGGMSGAGDWFISKVRTYTEENRFFKDFPIPQIVNAKFSNDAGVIGAAMLAKAFLK